MQKNVAVVAGSTGLIGKYLLNVLLEDAFYDGIVALTRRPIAIDSPKVEQRTVDYDRLTVADLAGATHLFCCLGTTLKTAGSREAFRRVDYDYCARFAQLGREAGAVRLMLVSSAGASSKASSLYLKTKGETEDAVSGLGFEALHIFRPSMLMGQRDEERALERFLGGAFRGFEFLMKGALSKFRPMPAGVLSAAMAAAGERGETGIHIHYYDGIVRLAGFSR